MNIQYINIENKYSSDEKILIKHIIGNRIKDLVPLNYYIMVMNKISNLYCLSSLKLNILMWIVLLEKEYIYVVIKDNDELNSINTININDVGYGVNINKTPRAIWFDYIFGLGNIVLNLEPYIKYPYLISKWLKDKGIYEILGGFEVISKEGTEGILTKGILSKQGSLDWGIYQKKSRYANVNTNLSDYFIISLDGLEIKLNSIKEIFLGKGNQHMNLIKVSVTYGL